MENKGISLLIVFVVLSCGPGSIVSNDASTTDDGIDLPAGCTPQTDADGDTILDEHEGSGDFDGDTVPNPDDEDSDGDTIPDAREAGDDDCLTEPVDSDGDGSPDFLDRDSDNNAIDDFLEWSNDTDSNTIPDYLDPDNDGDGIPDEDEVGDDPSNPVDSDGDGVPDYVDTDSDGDTIADSFEGVGDPDGDGVPSYLDLDSDGDGFYDEEERDACLPGDGRPVDSDGDGVPDFLDSDSDGDGLFDSYEREIGTARCLVDTDGDGFSDLAEHAHPTADPLDPDSGIPETDFFIILPPGVMEERLLDFGTEIKKADIFFLVDTTGSMYEEMNRIKNALALTIIPTIRIRIADSWYGVGWYADFAYGDYGQAPDMPFELIQTMTPDSAAAQAAVDLLPERMGGDAPESQVEALYQAATGEGLGAHVPPHECFEGSGAPCFRQGSVPIILLFTDAPMHNGPPGTVADDYTGITPEPHVWSDAIRALNIVGAKVIGLDSEGPHSRDAYGDLVATARATGTVDFKDNPLVFDIGRQGEDLDTRVVAAVEILATEVPMDIDTYTVDLPDLYDEPGWEEVDARCFIKRRVPQPGWIPPAGYREDEAVAAYDESTFYSVLPGTRITFMVEFGNVDGDTACYEAGEAPRAFAAKIVVRGDGVADLDERIVLVIVPSGRLDP